LLRILEGGAAVDVIPTVLHEWRLSEASLSSTSADYSDDAFGRCRASFLASGFLGGGDDYELIGYGNTGKRLLGDLQRLGKRCRKIYELHPGRIGQVIHGAPVMHHDDLREGIEYPLLVSVAGSDARIYLRTMLSGFGFSEGRDFVCTA